MTIFSTRFAAIRQAFTVVYAIAAIVLVILVVALSLSPAYNVLYYFNPLTGTEQVNYAINGEEQGTVSLPATITGIAPGSSVSVFLESSGNEHDNLLVEVDSAQCTLYIDDTMYFSVGNPGTYPAFQKEPPRSVDIVSLPDVAEGTELRLDYTLSPIADSLLLQPFYNGDQNLITKHILLENYLALILSLMMLVMGIALAIIGLVLYSRVELAIALFWLGLTCLTCGCWTFFANDIILLFFSQFSVFYTISYVSLFALPIPLTRFCISYVVLYRSRPLAIFSLAVCLFFVAVVLLHVFGVYSFGQLDGSFRIAEPLVLAFYLFVIVRMRKKKKADVSSLYLFGMALFAALAFFDSMSAYLGVQSPVGTFFVLGLSFATVVIARLIWEHLSDALDAMERNARLESELSAINRSLDLQRKHFRDFSQSAEETRRIRHDLRHQLVAIKGLIQEEKADEALEYIERLSSSIPSISEMLVCDNAVVNSLAVHFVAQAEAENILCDVKMVVPQAVGTIPDGDLSIIVGNLFENALEACAYVEPDKRFIKVRCSVSAKRFTLAIDNSFDGELQITGTDFYSRKRKGFGIGVASVRSVVSKYGGSMKYEAESGVFKTSLYIKIGS